MDRLLDRLDVELVQSPRVTFSLPDIPELSIMKEQTYGWYPAVRDVYTERRLGVPNTYDLEAMYKFKDSKYYTAPKPLTSHSLRPPPSPQRRPSSSVSAKSGKESSLSVRAKSAPIYNFKKIPRLNLPTPQECWEMNMKASETDVNESVSSASLPSPHIELTPQPPTPIHTVAPPPPSPPKSITPDARKERIKSAVIRRDRITRPERPVKSAGPGRSPVVGTPAVCEGDVTEINRSSSRPVNPVPQSPVNYSGRGVTSQDISRPTTADLYEQGLKEYGWRFEVHGDPFKLKRKTFSKRLPIYVTVKEPEMDPEGPKVKMENMETFFYNTIPRRPATFTIHKEWISETIHAKRMELQKREGVKHRWKNFSFVY